MQNMTMMSAASSFPRFSLSGTLILAAYLSFTKTIFDMTYYSTCIRSGKILYATSSSSSIALMMNTMNGVVTATSFLNTMSHAAVVLGALHDTYVLSILVGVGFDIVTQILYVIWWVQLSIIVAFSFSDDGLQEKTMEEKLGDVTTNNGYAWTIFFLIVLSIVYSCQIVIHIQAIQTMSKSSSYNRIIKLLRSSLNNIRGIAGEGYRDHLFAYSDLGGHVAPFCLSLHLLHRQQALHYGVWSLVVLVLLSGLIFSRVPLNNSNAKCESNNKTLVKLKRGSIIECSCPPCMRKFQLTGKHSSFTFTRRDGVCCLWLYSFEELSHILMEMSDSKMAEERR